MDEKSLKTLIQAISETFRIYLCWTRTSQRTKWDVYATLLQSLERNDSQIAYPDIPQSPIGIIFRFTERQTVLIADVEAVFLRQIAKY